jgi:three-Cys-motif partner protein
MGNYEDNFFKGKQPWSLIKDAVLSCYIEPYIAKVKRLGKQIVLIDGYAGPGVFEDGGKGSPMILCSAAEKFAKGCYTAYFFNNEKKYHEKLEAAIRDTGWSHSAHCILGDSLELIKQKSQILKDHTVFLYLDPFGLKGCGFDQIEPFLTRNIDYSTEIVLNMCMPAAHRLAACYAVEKGKEDLQIKSNRQLLTTVFGGDYWKDIVCQENIDKETKESQLINAYLTKLRKYLPYAGCCPIREASDRQIKYFMIFVSRHPHAMLLMNDCMYQAYFAGMHKADFAGTLFENLDWKKDMPLPEENTLESLKTVIEGLVSQYPGEDRDAIWLKVVQASFMRYDHSLYLEALKQLSKERIIQYSVDPRTKKPNKHSKLFPAQYKI